jgi:hypothetical protein
MRTLFLLTVLFVLLAFAFKQPNQSAWDFAQQLSGKVAGKVAGGIATQVDRDNPTDYGRKIERKVKENFAVIRKRYNNADKKIESLVTERIKPEVKQLPVPKPVTKPKPTPPIQKAQEPRNKTNAPVLSDQKEMTLPVKRPSIKNPIDLAPTPPAKPVTEVSVKSLPEPKAIEPSPLRTFPIDSAELAEIGARFNRASRLLNEIK